MSILKVRKQIEFVVGNEQAAELILGRSLTKVHEMVDQDMTNISQSFYRPQLNVNPDLNNVNNPAVTRPNQASASSGPQTGVTQAAVTNEAAPYDVASASRTMEQARNKL